MARETSAKLPISLRYYANLSECTHSFAVTVFTHPLLHSAIFAANMSAPAAPFPHLLQPILGEKQIMQNKLFPAFLSAALACAVTFQILKIEREL